MIKKIIKFPAPSLRNPCREVEFRDDWFFKTDFTSHLNDLRDTLAATPNGIALASNQIAAEGYRVFVVRPQVQWPLVRSMDAAKGIVPEVVINPKIREYIPHEVDLGPTWATSGERELFDYKCFVEGCLSLPEQNRPIDRPYWIEVEYNNEQGERLVYIARGLTARMIQHECDHLDGKLIYDYLDTKSQILIRNYAIKNRKAGR
jgi:peptide deformylase